MDRWFWCFGILLLIPNVYSFEYDKNLGDCKATYSHLGKDISLVYKVALFGLGFAIPVMIMVFTYLMVIREFYSKVRVGDVNQSQVKVKYRRKVVAFLAIIILVFLLCWSPFGIFYFVTRITPKSLDYNAYNRSIGPKKRLYRFMMLPCCCAATLNVVCFAIKDKEIRRCFKALMRFKNPARSQINTSSFRRNGGPSAPNANQNNCA